VIGGGDEEDGGSWTGGEGRRWVGEGGGKTVVGKKEVGLGVKSGGYGWG